MSCLELRRWLDQGRPERDAAAARAHTTSCVECAALVAADQAIERLLMEDLTPAPVGFTARLMARLEAAPIAAAPLPPVDLPWWLRAAVDPAAVLALALASLVVWRGRWLWASAALAGNALGGGLASFFSSAARVARSSPALDWLSSPDIGLGVEIGFLCLMLIAAPALYRSVLRLTLRAAGAR